jgi:hypothetical protein
MIFLKKFNDLYELNKDTYISAAKKLSNLGHINRSANLKKHTALSNYIYKFNYGDFLLLDITYHEAEADSNILLTFHNNESPVEITMIINTTPNVKLTHINTIITDINIDDKDIGDIYLTQRKNAIHLKKELMSHFSTSTNLHLKDTLYFININNLYRN